MMCSKNPKVKVPRGPFYQYEEYRRLLELYIQIDTDITKRLALRASLSNIEDIREAGEDFLALLATQG
jgi:hypothetical protein